MIKNTIIVGLGGFIGSAIRYLTGYFVHEAINTSFPLGTMLINILGCLLIGFLSGLFESAGRITTEMQLFLTVGFCGGFTTFSTFSNDGLKLVNAGEYLSFSLYIGLSVFLGLACTFLGKYLAGFLKF